MCHGEPKSRRPMRKSVNNHGYNKIFRTLVLCYPYLLLVCPSGNSPNEATTSDVSHEEEGEVAGDDGEETESDEDFAGRQIETDDEDSDADWRSNHRSCDEGDGGRKREVVQVARSACLPTSAANGRTKDGFACIKTEIGSPPCTTPAPPAGSTPTNGPSYSGSAVNEHGMANAAVSPSRLGGVVSTRLNRAVSTLANGGVSRQNEDVTNSSPSPAARYSHQLYHSCESGNGCWR